MEKVAIVTDSNSGLSREEGNKLGITILPMSFTVNGIDHKEEITLSKKEFFEALRSGAEVSTSQPSLAELDELWKELLKDHDKVIHIPMAKALSGGYASAVAFSQEFEGKVLVVDANRISVTQASAAKFAKELADQGMSAEQIKERLESTALEADIYITVETLEYLRRGGRISSAVAVAGELLHVKPVLHIVGGQIESFAKVRGAKKAKKTIEDAIANDYKRLAEKFGPEKVQVYVGHADAPQEAAVWAEEYGKMYPDHKVEIADLPMSISCHVGPGTVGAAVCVN